MKSVKKIVDREGCCLIRCLESWTPDSYRIIIATLYSKYIKTTMVPVYAPSNNAEDKVKKTSYNQVQKVLDVVPRHNVLLVQTQVEQHKQDTGEDLTYKESKLKIPEIRWQFHLKLRNRFSILQMPE